MRFAAVLDGTVGGAERRARALGRFLREGLCGDVSGETIVLYADDGARERLVALSPTRDVHLLKTLARRPGHSAELLGRMATDGEIPLLLFAGGPSGAELATRLACRTGGGVLTEALSVHAGAERLLCRRAVYSGHLVGRFELSRPPWYIGLDAGWGDAAVGPAAASAADAPPAEHRVLSDTDGTGGAGSSPFEDVEVSAFPSSDDLEQSRFLVVAGSGAGSRRGVERIADAARKMGAAFGVTRPVAMNAWAPMDRLVGVSGSRTAPALCIVAGASGAPAFYWGIEKAGFIVAIDVDDHAPIVGAADAVIRDDATAVVEELAKVIAGEDAG